MSLTAVEKTTQPTLHQPLHSKVANYLNSQRRQAHFFCDLIIELETEATDNAVFGHFCVVGAQSRFIGGSHFLQKSLQFSIHNPLKITVRNFTCMQCLQTMMDFFYEDVVSIAKEHEEHFKKLAKMLGVTELLNLFEPQAETIVKVESKVNDGIGTVTAAVGGIGEKDNADAAVLTAAVDIVEKYGNDVNLVIENIFDDQRNYFKLKNTRVNTSLSNKINFCMGCDFKCFRVQEMMTHMSSCEASHLTCSLCEVGFLGWRQYDAHLRKHSADVKKPFFCLECDVRFMTRAALMAHYPKHSAEAPHHCPHCNKGFKWKHGLSSHLLIHNKDKQMLCDVCGYSTTHMKALKSHKLQHTEEFYKCTYAGCMHRSNRKENLKIHMETHKQERPFVCEVCGCKFSQNKNLKRHALKHSTEETSKYKCQLCSFQSHRSDKLKEHVQRVHTEKAVQLELPEIVENAFEKKFADEFMDLSMMTSIGQSSSKDDGLTKAAKVVKRVRKKPVTKVLAERRLKPLAPKTEKTTS